MNAPYPTTEPVTIGGGLNSVELAHVLFFPTVKLGGKSQQVRRSASAKPLGLVLLTIRDEHGEPIGTVQVPTADLRAALTVPKGR